MTHIRKFIFLTILLTLTAGCGSMEDGEQTSNSGNTPAATNSNATANASSNNTGRKLSDQEGTLLVAAAKGDIKTVKDLLDKGVSVDTRDPNGNTTPLGHAVWAGHDDMARLLIERGADVNAKTNEGVSVLGFATMRKHKELADMLRAKGAQ